MTSAAPSGSGCVLSSEFEDKDMSLLGDFSLHPRQFPSPPIPTNHLDGYCDARTLARASSSSSLNVDASDPAWGLPAPPAPPLNRAVMERDSCDRRGAV